MTKQPLVSIIINCFNGQSYLKKSVSSILNQTYKNWEIIFWDNKSTDNSKKILKNFKDRRIKYFYSKKFNTLYKSRNLAIKKTKGNFVCFLDTDDFWKKNKLKEQINIMLKKNYDIIYSNYQIKNERKNTLLLRTKNQKTIGNETQKLLNDYSLGILTVMVKKKVFKKYLFDPSYTIIGDFDFFLKMSLKYNYYYHPKVLAVYRSHDNNFSYQRIDIYIDELKKWVKNNKQTYKNFSFVKIYLIIFKLIIKKIFKF